MSGKPICLVLARIIAVAAAMSASGAVASTPNASAAPPAPTAIQATVTMPNPIFGGVWGATGAVNDSGTFVRTGLNLTGSFFLSPVVAAFQTEIAFTGEQGTLKLRVENSFMSNGATGVWEVESGTGAYQGLTGHGTLEFDFPSSITFTGVIGG